MLGLPHAHGLSTVSAIETDRARYKVVKGGQLTGHATLATQTQEIL